jgi:CheY-like chemotaxis protein
MAYSPRILCADDDLEVRTGVVDLLSAIGLDVLEAETGLEAIELAREARIDAALLDLHMPGCTGIEALPRLRELRLGLPCLVYSGDWTDPLRELALAAGAFRVLAKPIQAQVLRSEVLAALESWPDGFLGHTPFNRLDSRGGNRRDGRGA